MNKLIVILNGIAHVTCIRHDHKCGDCPYLSSKGCVVGIVAHGIDDKLINDLLSYVTDMEDMYSSIGYLLENDNE